MFPTEKSTWKFNRKKTINNKKMQKIRKNVPLLASSEDAKPVEVIRRERNCPNPRPITVFFVQKFLKLLIIFLFLTLKQD